MAGFIQSEFTQILQDIEAGNSGVQDATGRLFELVYTELRDLARDIMRSQRVDHTLQPTALVHEAYCKLVDGHYQNWDNRAHFFGIAGRAMRQILVEHARKLAAIKRGGNQNRVTLHSQLIGVNCSDHELLEIDELLSKLEILDSRLARTVELRVFVGMTMNEIAQVLDVSRRTIQNDWRIARMWLSREYTAGERNGR